MSTREVCEREIINADDWAEYNAYLDGLAEVSPIVDAASTLGRVNGRAVIIVEYAADVCTVRHCGSMGIATNPHEFVVPTCEVLQF